MNVKPLFKLMVDKRASDLFFTTHAPVMIKIDGRIVPVNQMELTPKMVRQAALELNKLATAGRTRGDESGEWELILQDAEDQKQTSRHPVQSAVTRMVLSRASS